MDNDDDDDDYGPPPVLQRGYAVNLPFEDEDIEEEATGYNLDAPPEGVDLRNQDQENPDGSGESNETGKVINGGRRRKSRRKSRRSRKKSRRSRRKSRKSSRKSRRKSRRHRH